MQQSYAMPMLNKKVCAVPMLSSSLYNLHCFCICDLDQWTCNPLKTIRSSTTNA